MTEWSYTLEDKSKTVLCYMNSFSSTALTMPLNAPATLSGTIAHNSTDMDTVYQQLKVDDQTTLGNALFIRAVRDGTTRFWGVLNDLQVAFDDSGLASLTFTDIAGMQAGAHNYTVASDYKHWTTFYKKNPTWVSALNSLLSKGDPLVSLTVSGSPAGRVPNNESLANASGHAKLKGNVWKTAGNTVLESLQELSGFYSGIEWYTLPDATLRVGDGTNFSGLTNTLGTDKTSTVQFQYGANTKANIMTAQVSFQPPVNSLFYTDSKGIIKRSINGYSSTSVAAHGEYCTTRNWVSRTNQTDDDRAQSLLRTKWRHVADVVLEPSLAPSPWTDYFLGDQVSVRVQRDSLDMVTNPRISQIVVSTDEQGREVSHQVSFEVV